MSTIGKMVNFPAIVDSDRFLNILNGTEPGRNIGQNVAYYYEQNTGKRSSILLKQYDQVDKNIINQMVIAMGSMYNFCFGINVLLNSSSETDITKKPRYNLAKFKDPPPMPSTIASVYKWIKQYLCS